MTAQERNLLRNLLHVRAARARVEGTPVLSEGLATYRAHRLVKETYGIEHLSRMRTEDDILRATLPLLTGPASVAASARSP